MSNQSDFPTDPQLRRTILVTTSDNKMRIEGSTSDEKSRVFRNIEGILLLAVPCELGAPVLKNLEERSLLVPGSLLIQSPYDHDSYEELANAPIEFALTKLLCLSEVCRLLGARKVNSLAVEAQTEQGDVMARCEVGAQGVGVKADARYSTLNKIARRVGLNDTFVPSGAQPNVEAAKAYARSYKLNHDPQIRSLIDAQSAGPARIGTRKVEINLSREMSSSMKFSLGLDVPIYADIGLQISKIKNERYEYILRVDIEF